MDPTRTASDPTGASSPAPGAPNPVDATQTASAVAGSATSASALTGPVPQATTASDSATWASQPNSSSDSSDVDAVLSQGIVSPRRTVVNAMEMPDLNAIRDGVATSSQPTAVTAQSVATPARRFAPPKRAAIPSAKFVQEDGTTNSSLRATPNAPTPATNPATVATGSATIQPAPTPTPVPAPKPAQNPMASAQDRGDIILPSGRPSGGKKLSKFAKLAIAGVATIVLLLGVAGVALLAQQSQNSGEGSDYTSEEAVDAWNSFFTYLVYGRSRTGTVYVNDEDALVSDFAFASALSAQSGTGAQYFTELMSLFTVAANAITANYPDLSSEVESLRSGLAVLSAVEQAGSFDLETLIEQYYQQMLTMAEAGATYEIDATSESTVAYFEDLLSALNASGDETQQAYYDAAIAYIEDVLGNNQMYYCIALCIQDDDLDTDCARSVFLVDNADLETATDTYTTLALVAESVKTAAISLNMSINADFFGLTEDDES